MRDARVFGTGLGQNWRVTGITAGDAPPAPPRVGLEFWIGSPDDRYDTVYHRLVPDTFDPDLARLLADHLNEMADYAEEKNVTNLIQYFDTSKRTQNKNIREVVLPIEELAEFLDEILPGGSEKTTAMRKLLEAKDAACRSALDLPE